MTRMCDIECVILNARKQRQGLRAHFVETTYVRTCSQTSLFIVSFFFISCVHIIKKSMDVPWTLVYALGSPAYNLERAAQPLSNTQLTSAVLPKSATSSAGSQWWTPKQSSNMIFAQLYANTQAMNPVAKVAPYFTCATNDPLGATPACSPLRDHNPDSSMSGLALTRRTGLALVPAPPTSYQRNAYVLPYPNSGGFYGSSLQVADYPTDIARGPMQCMPNSIRLDGCFAQ